MVALVQMKVYHILANVQLVLSVNDVKSKVNSLYVFLCYSPILSVPPRTVFFEILD